MLYVDGMNGVIDHTDTVQWLYSLLSSKARNHSLFDNSVIFENLFNFTLHRRVYSTVYFPSVCGKNFTGDSGGIRTHRHFESTEYTVLYTHVGVGQN